MGKITMQDLASVLSQKRGLTKEQADSFVNGIFEVLNQGLERDRIAKIKGLGTFKITNVRNRESVNVNTGERVVIEGHGKLSFTPETLLRDMINKPFAQFETVALNDGVDFSDIDKAFAVSIEDETEDKPVETAEPTGEPQSVEEATVAIQQEPVEEPQPEPLQAEPEPVAEEKPIDEQPVAEPEKPEEQPEEVETETAEVVEAEPEETEEDEEERSSLSRVIIWCVVFCVIAAAAGVLGYYFGTRTDKSSVGQEAPAVVPQPVSPIDSVKPQPQQKPDTADVEQPAAAAEKQITVTSSAEQDAGRTAEKKPAKPVEEEKKDVSAQPKPQTDEFSKYNNYDARVRTGAYRIVGVDRTVKVKEGETLKGIAERFLGPGMECYVEAINGKRNVKPGDVVKIPKVKVKKSKSGK